MRIAIFSDIYDIHTNVPALTIFSSLRLETVRAAADLCRLFVFQRPHRIHS